MTLYRHQPGPRYAEAVVVNGLIFHTQVPANPDADARSQTANVLEQVEVLLQELGSDKTRLVDATIFLADLADYDAMNEAWDAWVVAGHTPTRATVQAKLADPRWKVEIKLIATR
jgi:enamine deaminase RidA (YjgF/YER057c/UK114 family)